MPYTEEINLKRIKINALLINGVKGPSTIIFDDRHATT